MAQGIKRLVKDKSIIFVGNSVEIMHHKHADFIYMINKINDFNFYKGFICSASII